jgi:hypothetical protein
MMMRVEEDKARMAAVLEKANTEAREKMERWSLEDARRRAAAAAAAGYPNPKPADCPVGSDAAAPGSPESEPSTVGALEALEARLEDDRARGSARPPEET